MTFSKDHSEQMLAADRFNADSKLTALKPEGHEAYMT